MKAKRILIVTLLILTLPPATVATAAVKNWLAGSGNWNTGANWTGGTVPMTDDTVRIFWNDGVGRTITYDVSAPALGLLSIGLTGPGATMNTLSLPNNNTLTTAGIRVGGFNGITSDTGRGAVNQSAGTTTISPGFDLSLAWGGGSTGTYTLGGGALAANQSEFIGYSGTGTFNHTAGTNTVTGDLYLGYNGGSVGDYTLSGGALAANQSEFIGYSGIGTFNHTAGTNTLNSNATGSFFVGYNAGATGTYNLSGTGSLASNEFVFIGHSGTGVFNQTGGTHTISGYSVMGGFTVPNSLCLGYNTGSSGTYTLSGGNLSVTDGGEFIGFQSSGIAGTFIQSGGTHFVSLDLYIGLSSTSTGRYEQTGGTFHSNGNVRIAEHGGGELIVDGPTTTFTSGGYLSLAFFDGTGSLVISGGGTVNTLGALGAEIGRNSGTAYVTVNGPGSHWDVTTELDFDTGTVDIQNQGSLSVGTELRVITSAATLNIENQGLVSADSLRIDYGTVNLQGGTLRFNTIGGTGGLSKLNYAAGTIQLAGNRTIGSDAVISQLFGAVATIVDGKGLTVEGTATLQSGVNLDGGTFTAPSIVFGQNLHLHRGTFNLTNQAVTIGSGGALGSALDVNDDMTVNVTLGITNQGLVTGDGQIGGTFANAAAGELRAEPGRSLKLTGANNTNAGQISLYGGMLEFAQNLTNNAGAFISGNGTLKAATGLTNNGTMNFSGLANIVGDVTNSAAGKIISSGGGPTTFLDDVTNNGEIRTSAGSFTVFFGAASGAGTYTGAGTVNFEGDLKPGNSPASVSFGGNVVFGPESTLVIEIGGVTPGSQYDQINVAGTLTLDGTLEISLVNGFTPALGSQFTVLNFASSSGDFTSYEGLVLGGHLGLRGRFGPSGLLLTARPAVDGDINLDGTVNIFDVNSVSSNWGAAGPQGDANGDGTVNIFDVNLISSNWGATGGGATAVPEPATLILALCGLLGGIGLRTRRQVCSRVAKDRASTP